MVYVKYIEDGYITAIGINAEGEEITDTEYNEIMEVIHAKPSAEYPMDYRLKTDLTWELYEIVPPVPVDEPTAEEVLAILTGEQE